MMADMQKVAAALAQPAPRLRFRQGVIVSVQADGTCTVTIGGDGVNVANIHYASHVCPIPGSTVWLASDGLDVFVIAALAPAGPAYASARKTTTQAIPTATWTALDWTSRSASAAGITLGNDGFTIVVPGLYTVTASVDFASNATGQRHCAIYLNGAPSVQGTGHDAATGSEVTRLTATTTVPLVAGDLINAYCYQSSGANLTTSALASYNILRAVWVGPTA